MSSFKVDFFVVGAARCGTTSLYNYLSQHPQIYLPAIKELNYFSNVESKDHATYLKPKKDKHYHTKIIKKEEVYKSVFEDAKKKQQKGDISPSYLWDKETAKRIYAHNPNAKIIISLRNPVQRAFSHYVMNVSIGHENAQSFADALKKEPELIWGGGSLYLQLSAYYEAVKPYFDVFPKENICILVFEDWIKNKDKTLTDIYEFIGVDKEFEVNHTDKHNEKVAYKNLKTLNFLRSNRIKPILDSFLSEKLKEKIKTKIFKKEAPDFTIDSQLETKLSASFKDDVAKLEKLTDIPFLKKWGYK